MDGAIGVCRSSLVHMLVMVICGEHGMSGHRDHIQKRRAKRRRRRRERRGRKVGEMTKQAYVDAGKVGRGQSVTLGVDSGDGVDMITSRQCMPRASPYTCTRFEKLMKHHQKLHI